MTSLCLYNQQNRHHLCFGAHRICWWMFEWPRPGTGRGDQTIFCEGSGAGQPCGFKCKKTVKAFRVRLLLITRHTGKRQLSTLVLRSLTFYPIRTAVRLCNFNLNCIFIQPSWVWAKCEQMSVSSWAKPDQRPEICFWGLISTNSRALFNVCCTFDYKQCRNIQVLFHHRLNNGTFSGSECIASQIALAT